jgi:hypothetical protein
LRTARAPIRNGSAGQVVVVGACVSPLVEERTQLAIPGGALAAQVAAGTLAAGEAAMVEIGGAVPARPGSYMAHLDVRCDGVTLSTLVRANVAASAVWGIGCMMLGLLLLGVLKLMTGEGDAQERTREALRTRGEIHAAWQRNPPPQSRRAEVAEIDYDLDEAVRTLARPRGFSVVDRRLADSGELLTAGREAAAKLRDAMAKEPPGTAEVAELAREWNDFQNDLRSLAVPDVGAAGAAGLVGHAAVLLNRAWTQLVGLRVQAAATELGAQFGRVRLVQAAGETPKAQEMAIATRGGAPLCPAPPPRTGAPAGHHEPPCPASTAAPRDRYSAGRWGRSADVARSQGSLGWPENILGLLRLRSAATPLGAPWPSVPPIAKPASLRPFLALPVRRQER